MTNQNDRFNRAVRYRTGGSVRKSDVEKFWLGVDVTSGSSPL
jgi:hypothetical protein